MKVKYFTDFDKFSYFTGMLVEETDWDKIGIYPDDENGMFDVRRLDELKDFCARNPKYHILTNTSDGDDRTTDEVAVITISNEIRIINRLNYYLGDGSKQLADLAFEFR